MGSRGELRHKADSPQGFHRMKKVKSTKLPLENEDILLEEKKKILRLLFFSLFTFFLLLSVNSKAK